MQLEPLWCTKLINKKPCHCDWVLKAREWHWGARCTLKAQPAGKLVCCLLFAVVMLTEWGKIDGVDMCSLTERLQSLILSLSFSLSTLLLKSLHPCLISSSQSKPLLPYLVRVLQKGLSLMASLKTFCVQEFPLMDFILLLCANTAN